MDQLIADVADVRIGDGRAWVLVSGPVDADRAVAVRAVVDELSRRESIRRVSVDLTCVIAVNPVAAASLKLLRRNALPWVDVAQPGAVGRLLRRARTRQRQMRGEPKAPTGSRGHVTMGHSLRSGAPGLTPPPASPRFCHAPLEADDRVIRIAKTRP